MNKFSLIMVLAFFAAFVCAGCTDDYADFDRLTDSVIIEGLTVGNFPKLDGSTSTEPLCAIIACKLFGVRYEWAMTGYQNLRRIQPNLNKDDTDTFEKLIKSSQTHQSFVNLIGKEADLILSARAMSPDEKALAAAEGVNLIETPIALDALVFIVNPRNSIESLTIKQIQDIYTKKITNWNEVGGNTYLGDYDAIEPYIRNANSGSQELMEALVMKNIDVSDLPVDYYELMSFSMTGAFEAVLGDINAICFTVYYYKEYMITDINVKGIAINGIPPTKETIGDNSYPLAAPVYAVIRSDLDQSSMAYKLYEWLQTDEGRAVIAESGYALK